MRPDWTPLRAIFAQVDDSPGQSARRRLAAILCEEVNERLVRRIGQMGRVPVTVGASTSVQVDQLGLSQEHPEVVGCPDTASGCQP